MSILDFVTILMYGLSLGAILALVALGLSLTFGLMNVLNFAHGIFYTIGAYIFFYCSCFYPSMTNFWIVILIAFLATAVMGLCVERTLIRKLYGKDIVYSILLTYAFGLICIDLFKVFFGVNPKPIPDPFGGATVNILVPDLAFPLFRLISIIAAMGLYFIVWIFFSKTMIGKAVIAGIEDFEGLRGLGLNPTKPFLITFVLGAGLAGVGGVFHAPLIAAYPYMGSDIMLYSLAIVVTGGLANFRGTLLSAIIFGEAMSFAGYFWGSSASVIVFILLAIVFLMKPERGVIGK